MRTAEPSPVGVDRVVDYSRRQRREVQMDLFAREFLLPRPKARGLFLEDGMSASAIAARLGAPFEVIAQQLFDALLLPPIPSAPEGARSERPLNPEQKAAADHRGGAYLLEAGPGTGKTQTLTSRVHGLIAEGVDPRRILVLTFSNKAARELVERLAGTNKSAAAAIPISTFHGFGLDVIRRFHAELGLPKDPRLLDRTEAVELLEAEFPKLRLVHFRNLYDPSQVIADMLPAISRAKDEVVSHEEYADLVQKMAVKGPSDAADKAGEVAQVYALYEKLKAQKQAVDFGDLVSLPVRLLEGNETIRAHFQAQYDHVLVDEYQDVNRSSVRLLTALRPDGCNLWVVGDAKQSIYRFRGASSFNMSRFGIDDFKGGVRSRLKINYRSCGEIVDTFGAFAVEMKAATGDSSLNAERGEGGNAPLHRTIREGAEQAAALADMIEALRAQGLSYRDQAILCTGNEKLSEFARDLERLGIPVLFLGSLFERPEVKDMLALLSLLTDKRAMGLVRIATWPEFAMPLQDVGLVIDHLRSAESEPLVWLETIDTLEGVSGEGRAALQRLRATLAGFAPDSQPWIVLAEVLLDRCGLLKRWIESASVGDQNRCIALWQLLNFIRVQPPAAGLPAARLLARIRRLVRLSDDGDLRQLPAAAQGLDAVRLMTIHGSKGLEFPAVHIPGMNADTMPGNPRSPACLPPDGMVAGWAGDSLSLFKAGNAEERECLFYVALSRAKDRLVLYSAREKVGGVNRPPSTFLARLGAKVAQSAMVLTRTLPDATEETPIGIAIAGRLRVTDAQIAVFEKCPRRFFYTYLLRTGGRRAVTPFMQLHDAVRAILDAGLEDDMQEAAIAGRVQDACAAKGLAEEGYLDEYHVLGIGMVAYLVSTRADATVTTAEEVVIAVADDEIIVRLDDILLRPDGSRAVRRVRTGHLRSAESDDVAAAMFQLAAHQAFPGAAVEFVHLSDQKVRPLKLSAAVLGRRKEKLSSFMTDIRAGRFPTDPSPFSCPGCPAFFICGAVPDGILPKNF
jgi:superfamily I DNA/RNA helicase